MSLFCEKEVAVLVSGLVRQKSVHVEFARNGCRRRYTAGVVASRAHVDLAIGYRRHCELHGVAGRVTRALRTVPQLGGQICSVIGMKNRRAASMRLVGAILAAV